MIEQLSNLETWMIILTILFGIVILILIGLIVRINKVKDFVKNDEKEKELLLRMLKLGDAYKLPKNDKTYAKNSQSEENIG